MYCSHFGLHRPPFNNTPDPSFYYSTPDHEEALATLQYATLNRKGFVLVTGEVGAGKTLIGRMFIRQVDRQASTAVITHTQLNPRQLLGAICTEFELDVPPDATHLQLVDRLQQYLLDQFARNRFVVVLLDEAQNLPDESFEALRMLGNLEADDAKLLQVCILGQPELRQRFQSERMRQLDQRLFRRFHLTGLTPQQTIEYIQCRLQVAGCSRSDLFVPTAFDLIYEGSQGIPRLINRICDNALLAAYAQGSHQVDENMVQQVLDQEGLSREEIASPADAETEARIEHIYGSRPELVEADCADRMAAAPEASGEAVAKAVSTLSHAVAGTSACVAGSIEAQSRIQTEWSDRLDRTLAELSQQLQARASGTEVNDLRQKTDRLSERLDGLREAHAEGLRALQGEVERKLEAIQTELAAESSRLNLDSLRDETTQRTEAVRTELYRELEQRIRDLTERLESIRELQVTAGTTLQRELEDRLAAIHAEVEAVPHGEASVDKLASLREQTAQQIQAIQAESQARLTRSHQELDERIKQVLETVARLKTDHEIEVRNRAESITDQAVAIEDIYTSVGRHEDEIRHLSKTAAKRFEALTRGLNELREAAPHTGAMEQLRGEHAAFAREVLDRFAEKAAELDELKAMLDRQASMSGEQASTLAELSSRLERETKQLRRVRRHLLATHSAMKERFAALDGQYAARDELENLRQHQAAQAHEFLEQLQKARESVESLVADLTERFRCTHQRLDQLAAASETEGSDLADLRRAHAEDVANLLRQLEDQRRISQEQFEQTVAQWQAAQQEIESLRSAALDEAALAELRDRQQEQAEQILRLMDEQRRNLETLISAADQRYDELLARIETLPASVASTADVQSLQEESRSNKAALESAIRAVAEQWDRTGAGLLALENRVATVDSHLERLRQEHAQSLDEIVQRLDGQNSEYQQEFDALKQSWTNLRTELLSLVGSAMPVEKFEAAERVINRDMSALRQRLDEMVQRREKDVRVLVEVVQRLSDRVRELEEAERPQPVRVELRPRAAEELAALNSAAEDKAANLQKLLTAAAEMANRLDAASVQVEQSLSGWNEQADAVREQSEQLRASAGASAQILQAMRKCHDAIDSKLKSPAWHGQLRRGEELTARLEQVLARYESFEETVQTWMQQRVEADAVVQKLEKMLAEATRATARLGRVGALMAGVAGKNAIAEAVESAREYDDAVRPIRGHGRRNNAPRPDVEPVTWPKYRTHAQANAG